MSAAAALSVLGTVYPVMQAPIGASTTPELVAAVGLAGGLGCLPCRPTHVLPGQIAAVREKYAGPFAVNLLGKMDVADRIELILESDVPVVHWSWGVQPEAVQRLKQAGRLCLAQVGSREQAQAAERAGIDVLIVQGTEAAGGLQGSLPLEDLLAEVLASTDLPVMAAGGITNAAGASRALGLGAKGVMAGTVFVATHESDSHPLWIEQMIRADGSDTCVTDVFNEGDGSYRQRVLRNRAVLEWEAAGAPALGHRPGEGTVVAQYGDHAITRYDDVPPLRGMTGELDLLQMPAGTGVGAVTAVRSAAEVVLLLRG